MRNDPPASHLAAARADLVPYAPQFSHQIRTWLDSPQTVSDVCRSETFPPDDDIVDSWQRSDVVSYVLFADSQPVAYGELWPRAPEFAVEIAHLLVNPALRRRGFGGRMIQLLFERLRERPGVNKAVINLYSENPNALGCFLKAGFELTGTHKHVIGLRLVRLVR